ncbi:hypothetical protein KKF84_12645 [Myxococcota bacterium]|nr:hypothetical protein [Myxococcota bacterium]MBU1536164.1 hypothetical protein [Myxococcota bacterium]
MKAFTAVILFALLPAGSASAKVCFSCKDNTPAAYVCSDKDTFTARRNARKLGCKISSYSSICKCGAMVDSKSVFNPNVLVTPRSVWRQMLSLYRIGL